MSTRKGIYLVGGVVIPVTLDQIVGVVPLVLAVVAGLVIGVAATIGLPARPSSP